MIPSTKSSFTRERLFMEKGFLYEEKSIFVEGHLPVLKENLAKRSQRIQFKVWEFPHSELNSQVCAGQYQFGIMVNAFEMWCWGEFYGCYGPLKTKQNKTFHLKSTSLLATEL